MASSLGNAVNRMWYQGRWWAWLLLPLSGLFFLLTRWRRWLIQRRQKNQPGWPVPVIVIGNISVGGTGKTPLLIALCHYLKQQGYRPGIVSRGYGSRAPYYPYPVDDATPVPVAGDESWMIYRATRCPVMIAANRRRAVELLLKQYDIDVILSDDGLQHYRLLRDREIAVVDGERGLGNGFLLPAGPLRETASRLAECDWVISNGRPDKALSQQVAGLQTMKLEPTGWHNLVTEEIRSVDSMEFSQPVNAVVGIGNPQRFLATLNSLGVKYMPHIFEDHYQYSLEKLYFTNRAPVVMTEKDAVKVSALIEKLPDREKARLPEFWYLAVEARPDKAFLQQLIISLENLVRERKQTGDDTP